MATRTTAMGISMRIGGRDAKVGGSLLGEALMGDRGTRHIMDNTGVDQDMVSMVDRDMGITEEGAAVVCVGLCVAFEERYDGLERRKARREGMKWQEDEPKYGRDETTKRDAFLAHF